MNPPEIPYHLVYQTPKHAHDSQAITIQKDSKVTSVERVTVYETKTPNQYQLSPLSDIYTLSSTGDPQRIEDGKSIYVEITHNNLTFTRPIEDPVHKYPNPSEAAPIETIKDESERLKKTPTNTHESSQDKTCQK